MKTLCTLLLLTGLSCATLPSSGQVDTTGVKNFILMQAPGEEKFITLLKTGKTDHCLTYFSAEVVKKYGADSLRRELKQLSALFSKYPAPKVTYSLGQNLRGVGTFGHDSGGNYEKRSLYQFMDKDSVVYYFSLYYSDKAPVSLIKYYDSENFEEIIFRNIKPNIPAGVPPSDGNR